MSWSYAIMRHKGPVNIDGKFEYYYKIHEIYFDNPIFKKLGWTKEAIEPVGSTPKELIEVLGYMLKSAKKNPVFEYDTGKKLKRRKQCK